MDLGSTNGTFLNGERLESERYYELLEQVHMPLLCRCFIAAGELALPSGAARLDAEQGACCTFLWPQRAACLPACDRETHPVAPHTYRAVWS
jgi:hypothetical protein